jgi:hypothetical protein
MSGDGKALLCGRCSNGKDPKDAEARRRARRLRSNSRRATRGIIDNSKGHTTMSDINEGTGNSAGDRNTEGDRDSRSPREKRDSTNDPEAFAKGSVRTTQHDDGDGAPEGQLYDVPTRRV